MKLSNIYNRNVEMTTAEYAEYITKLLGKKVSTESVTNMCRKGKLNAYRSEINGRWVIKIQINFIPYDEYIKIFKELNECKVRLSAISSIVKLSDSSNSRKKKQASIYQINS